MAMNTAAVERVSTVAMPAMPSTARSIDTMISVRRRSHRSINTPAAGPTRLNGSRVTASTAAIRAGVAPRATSNNKNCAKVICANPPASCPKHCPPTNGPSGPASRVGADRQPCPRFGLVTHKTYMQPVGTNSAPIN
jgi:hypothetical protein